MASPIIDMEHRDIVGGLDRMVTDFAMAMIAVFPTLATLVATPWKLVPILKSEKREGRSGFLLYPGVFFILSLTIILLIAAFATTSDTLASNSGRIGPQLAVEVANAASEGQIWKSLSNIAPLYVLAVAIGMLGSLLKRWAGDWWTILVSLRAGFYLVSAVVSWIILSSVIIDRVKVATNNPELGMLLYNFNTIPIFALWVWIYFWMFKEGGACPKPVRLCSLSQ